MAIIQSVNPNNISDRYLDQLVELTLTTGYFQYVNIDRKVSYDYKERVKRYFVIPYLPYTKVILDELGNISGYYVGISKLEDDKMPHEDFSIYQNPDDVAMFKGIMNLYGQIDNKEYILHFLAVRFDLQGFIHPKYNKKIIDLLYEQIMIDFKESGCNEISGLSWNKYIAANKYYKKLGAYIAGTADLANTIYNDKLLLIKYKAK